MSRKIQKAPSAPPTTSTAPPARLTGAHRRFAEALASGESIVDAMRAAGWSPARVDGARMARDPQVLAFLEESRFGLFLGLTDQAFAALGELLDPKTPPRVRLETAKYIIGPREAAGAATQAPSVRPEEASLDDLRALADAAQREEALAREVLRRLDSQLIDVTPAQPEGGIFS